MAPQRRCCSWSGLVLLCLLFLCSNAASLAADKSLTDAAGEVGSKTDPLAVNATSGEDGSKPKDTIAHVRFRVLFIGLFCHLEYEFLQPRA